MNSEIKGEAEIQMTPG